jgi:hypothetical protein
VVSWLGAIDPRSPLPRGGERVSRKHGVRTSGWPGRLEVTCEFDTRGATGPVTPGWGTQNEMCLAGLYLVP